ncbi:hypothetical protein GGD50_006634 [Rhizobium paranaense]|uniref:Uncharacterized protein n=1 Tax=Rhizobium paranaense TaxID=1650438 RepID=A0A7W8XYL6_9HYPH|nr:hypothetical protein [Rhizobium paranaense]
MHLFRQSLREPRKREHIARAFSNAKPDPKADLGTRDRIRLCIYRQKTLPPPRLFRRCVGM